MRVKNLEGSGTMFPSPTCLCETWLDHWITNKGIRPRFCRCCLKETNDLVGGHVIKVDSLDKSRYIVPICRSCNACKGKEFDVNEDNLVSANCNNCKRKK